MITKTVAFGFLSGLAFLVASSAERIAVEIKMRAQRQVIKEMMKPVAVNVVVNSITQYKDRTELTLSWENDRECSYKNMIAFQGDDKIPELPRIPIKSDFGPSYGSRGKGAHTTGEDVWTFFRPSEPISGDFILVVRHDCNGHNVPSKMLVMDMEDFFPPTKDLISLGDKWPE